MKCFSLMNLALDWLDFRESAKTNLHILSKASYTHSINLVYSKKMMKHIMQITTVN